MTRERNLELLLVNDGSERFSRESYPKNILRVLSPNVFLTSPLTGPAFSPMPFQQGTGSIFDRMDAYVAASSPLKKSTGGLSVGSLIERMEGYVAASTPLQSLIENKPFDLSRLKLNLSCLNPSLETVESQDFWAKSSKKLAGGLSVGSLIERMEGYAASNPLKQFDWLNANTPKLDPEPFEPFKHKTLDLRKPLEVDRLVEENLRNIGWLGHSDSRDEKPLWERLKIKPFEIPKVEFPFGIKPFSSNSSDSDDGEDEKPLWERLRPENMKLPEMDFTKLNGGFNIDNFSVGKKSKLSDGSDWTKYFPGHSDNSDDGEDEKPLWERMEIKPSTFKLPKVEFPFGIKPFSSHSSDSDDGEDKPLWQQKMEIKPSTFKLPKVEFPFGIKPFSSHSSDSDDGEDEKPLWERLRPENMKLPEMDFTKLNGGFNIDNFSVGKKSKSSYSPGIGDDFPIYSPEPVALNLENTANSFKIFDSHKKGAPLVRYDQKPHEFGAPHLQYGERDFTGRTGQEAADLFAHILTKGTKIKWPFESESEDRHTVY